MHLNHKPGEVMQVDWAGDTAAVIDTEVPSRFMRKIVCRLRLNEVNRQ